MSKDKQALFRRIPGVDQLLLDPTVKKAVSSYPRDLVLKAINQVLDKLREAIQKGTIAQEDLQMGPAPIATKVVATLEDLSRPSLRPLVNATGVVVHTNLGRSILSNRVLKRFRSIAGGYSNLEYDLEQGIRGSRYSHVEGILKDLTSAEAAMVVNNNAGAVFLTLNTLAQGREVVISRGQLVEIGGSFRIPEVMRKSGAKMVEVGTTNKTHLRDYEEVIGPDTSLLLKVHTSNFQVVGFTEEVPLSELVILGKKNGIPVMEDLGSGSLLDFSKYGLIHEPTVQEVLGQGAGLVTFSGDKLLGGPQAGMILGQKDLVEAIRQNQLARALRIDKLTLMALEETLKLYRDEQAAIKEIPTLAMICEPYRRLARKAERLTASLGKLRTENFAVDLVDGNSRVGGGALPIQELPTRLVRLVPKRLPSRQIEGWLRSCDPPIIARLEKDRVLLDVRTIREAEIKTVAQAIKDLSHKNGE